MFAGRASSAGAVSFNEDIHDRGDESSNPENLAIRKVDQADVREALNGLPPELREIIVLREIEGCHYQVPNRKLRSTVRRVCGSGGCG
jgi:RNA polymerase sigma-70 factor (ECF subfamily)